MSKNFADFKYTKPAKEQPKPKISQDEQEQIKKTYDALKDMDSDALAKRLAQEVGKQKSEGNFDYDMLKSSVESMKSFLPLQTYENLKKLLENIR